MSARRIATVMGISALVAGSLLSVAAPAGAASATWSTETVVAGPSAAQPTRLATAVNGDGASATVWDQAGAGGSQVMAAVTVGGVTTTTALTDGSSTATNGGVVVDDLGRATVFWHEGDAWWDATSTGGAWSAPETVPTGPGYRQLAGVGITSSGTVELVALAPGGRLGSEAQALVKPAGGAWSPPVQLTAAPVPGVPRFLVNRRGQALLTIGFTTWRSPAPGSWDPPQQVVQLAGQTYATSAALDAGGRAYFLQVNRYGGTNLSTSTPTTSWTAPRRINAFASLGSSAAIVGSSRDHALVYGVDMVSGRPKLLATVNGGSGWKGSKPLRVVADAVGAVGSESGQYAVWVDNNTPYQVLTGTGVATTTSSAWAVSPVLARHYAMGPVAMSGDRVAASWSRGTDDWLGAWLVGTAGAVALP